MRKRYVYANQIGLDGCLIFLSPLFTALNLGFDSAPYLLKTCKPDIPLKAEAPTYLDGQFCFSARQCIIIT